MLACDRDGGHVAPARWTDPSKEHMHARSATSCFVITIYAHVDFGGGGGGERRASRLQSSVRTSARTVHAWHGAASQALAAFQDACNKCTCATAAAARPALQRATIDALTPPRHVWSDVHFRLFLCACEFRTRFYVSPGEAGPKRHAQATCKSKTLTSYADASASIARPSEHCRCA